MVGVRPFGRYVKKSTGGYKLQRVRGHQRGGGPNQPIKPMHPVRPRKSKRS